MDPFDQIWESSRTNAYSWGYPVFVWAGVGVLVALSLIRHNVLRRILKVVAIAGLAMTATQWSSLEIEEKRRLRGEWADTHPAEMTEPGYGALTIDGANRAVGPLIYGFRASLIFIAVAAALFVIRGSIRRSLDNLAELDVYVSYPLHWPPYETVHLTSLLDSRISTRAFFGNYKFRAPFPDLRADTNRAGLQKAFGNRCSVCRQELEFEAAKPRWVSLRVGTDVAPSLVFARSENCLDSIPERPNQYVQQLHLGGNGIRQPSPKSLPGNAEKWRLSKNQEFTLAGGHRECRESWPI